MISMNSKYFCNFSAYNSYIAKQNDKFLNIISINVRSVSSIDKFNEFKSYISQLSKIPDIIAIQETWFSKKFLNLYCMNGFNAIHCDRADGYGGTTIFINSFLKFKIIHNESNRNIDAIAIEVQDILIDNKKLVVASVYRSQRCAVNEFLGKLENILDTVGTAPVLLVGDINIDALADNRNKALMVNVIHDFGMQNCHTHVTRPRSQTSIDWAISNISEKIIVHCIENNFSDHNMISCCIMNNFKVKEDRVKSKKIIHYEKFSQILEKDLVALSQAPVAQDLCRKLIDVIGTAAEQSTLTITESCNIREDISPWMSEELISIINYKEKLLKIRRKKGRKGFINEQLKRIGRIIKNCNKFLMENYYQFNLDKCGSDIRKTFNFLNRELGRVNKPIAEICTEDGQSIIDENNKAAALNSYFFESIETLKNNIPCETDDDVNFFRTLVPEQSVFSFQQVERSQIAKVCDSLNVNKSAGYDNITPKMLMKSRELVIDILMKIFNNIVQQKKYPDVLKIHKVIPIPKKPNSRNVSEFRPVAVLSVIDKVVEKLLFEQLSNYLHEKNILYEYQFGFRKGSGTEEALVHVTNYICGGIDDGLKGVAGVFFDFSKAFDLVDHQILLRKLKNIGMTEDTVCLFRDFLQNRFQYVQIGSSKSTMKPVNYGVPQGSVLGPLLFKIYVNDLKNMKFNGKLIMFADDICILYRYQHEAVLKTQIEYDGSMLCEFSRINQLILNSGKTKFIKFRPYTCQSDNKISIHIDGATIEESANVTYLGVKLSHNLLWDDHIADVKAKISAATGVLYKFKNKLNTQIKMIIYQTLIHSRLTYLPLIYGCRANNHLKSLQSAQNRALKIVHNMPLRYSTVDLYKLKAKNVLPVRGLYLQQLCLYVFKATRGISSSSIRFNQNSFITGRLTRQSENFIVCRCRLELTKQRITFAGPSEFNKLPYDLRNVSILSTFKQQLKSYLLQNLESLLV